MTTDKITDTITRARVLLTAAVTWLLIAGIVIQAFIAEASDMFGVDHPAVVAATRLAALITTLVLTIRRVTPAPADERGLLPTDGRR